MRAPAALTVLVALALAAPVAGAAVAGKALFARGAVTGTAADGGILVLGKESPISEGDVITTGKRSFAVLEMNDGTRMSLRPETVFRVEAFRTDAGAESALLRLFKGGMRTITGYVSKRNPEAYKVRTAVATIGIRGTEFDVRLCGEDCRAETEKLGAPTEAVTSRVVGRVAFVRGDLSATGTDGNPRRMIVGAPLYEGDNIVTAPGGGAVLAFRDESRVTLSSGTSFTIETAKYDAADAAAGSQAFRLLRGGLRAVTGLIGRARPSAVRYNTPTATIGIRGTGFDLLCQGNCGATVPAAATEPALRGLRERLLAPLAFLVPAAMAQVPADAFFARVWSGAIGVEMGGRTETIPEGRIGQFGPGGFRFVNSLPIEFDVPRPDQVPVDVQKMFETKSKEAVEPGLYVSCITGHCSIDDEVDLGEGEGAYKGREGARPERIEPPQVLIRDEYFKAVDPEVGELLELMQPEGSEELPECQ